LPLPTRTEKTVTNDGSSSRALIPGLLSNFPGLWEFLTSSQLPDGSKRLTGRMSFSCERGVVTLSLTDDETDQYLSRSGRSMDDALLAAELAYADPDADWAPCRYPSKRKRK
jgi:hypothetical protein